MIIHDYVIRDQLKEIKRKSYKGSGESFSNPSLRKTHKYKFFLEIARIG